MPQAKARRAGLGPCPETPTHDVVFKFSSGGKLTWSCDRCECSGYYEEGGVSYRRRIEGISSLDDAVPAAPAPPAPAPTTTPAPPAPAPKKPGAGLLLES